MSATFLSNVYKRFFIFFFPRFLRLNVFFIWTFMTSMVSRTSRWHTAGGSRARGFAHCTLGAVDGRMTCCHNAWPHLLCLSGVPVCDILRDNCCVVQWLSGTQRTWNASSGTPVRFRGRATIPLGSNLGQVVCSHCLPSFTRTEFSAPTWLRWLSALD